MRRLALTNALTLALLLAGPALAQDKAAAPAPVHGIAMHGEPKYPPGFKHFDYVNPDAPKGGAIKLAAVGGFDSLNPFIIKGAPAVGLALQFDTLMENSADEAFTEYGLLAETVEVPEDRSWIIFNLRPEARFQDGSPVTAEDVKWTFENLRDKGRPFYRLYYGNVAQVEILGERRIKFSFVPGENRELPLILGQLPVLSKKAFGDRPFDQPGLTPLMGSGPYKVASFEPGRYIAFARDPQYWAKEVPVRRGFYNFDEVRFEYYRDANVAIEAFKAGAFDFRAENIAKEWATAYDVAAVRDGRLIKRTIEDDMPAGMQGFAFNLRRPMFQDKRVRQAITLAFDFEWTNKTLFYGQYVRTRSYFDNSELAATGLPGPAETAILEKFFGRLPEEVFTKAYTPPASDGSGADRQNLRQALALLTEAGWEVKDRKLVNKATGQPFRFEILLDQPTWERISLPFAKTLERLGMEVSLRTVDASQYKERLDAYDFDMIVNVWGQSLSPGNEQRGYWGSAAADSPGSQNYTGIKDPVIDELIEMVIAAPDREQLIARTKVLDRALQWRHLVVPHWHIPYDRVLYWNKFGMPETVPMQGYQFFTWWIDEQKARTLRVGAADPAPRAP